jgi:UDP-N-acetylmuramate dehydrogenase
MRNHTWFGIGGPADAYVAPADVDDLQWICAFAVSRGLSLFPLGGGSNTLFSDAGFRGIIVRMTKNFARMELQEYLGVVESGMNLLTFAKRCAEGHATGMEFGCGIPGTIGGAVKGNAGAFGVNTGDRLIWFEGMTVTTGEITRWKREEFPFRYRYSGIADDCVIVKACFQLGEGKREEIEETMRVFIEQKAASQPLSEESAGCIFKNPEGYSAGQLIDRAGCKGLSIGGAVVSERHANFIVNRGGARSDDVLRLIDTIRERVRQAYGVELEVEVKIVKET